MIQLPILVAALLEGKHEKDQAKKEAEDAWKRYNAVCTK
jgi:hypothetical protein